MKLKFKRVTARVSRVSSTVCIFFAIFCSTVSSVGLPSNFTRSEIQGTQDGRDFSSKSYERIDERLKVTALKDYISSVSSSIEDNHRFENNDDVVPESCTLGADSLRQMKSVSGSTWIIDNETLEILGNDPEKLIQCTEPGDRVIFNLSGVQKFERTMVVFHELELISDSFERIRSEAEYKNRSAFTCPDAGPFLIVNAPNFTVNGLILGDCKESSGDTTVVIKVGSSAVFEATEITNNNNRAIYVESQSNVEIKNSCFSNNGRSSLRGGVIFVASNVSLEISDSSFLGNEAFLGGVLYADVNSIVSVTASYFSGNKAHEDGDAIYLNSNNTLKVENSTMSQNKADYGGGAIYLSSNNNLNVENSTLSQNKADVGGAIFLRNDNNLDVDNSTMSKNKASTGGAICLSSNNTLNVENSTMSQNKADYGGGAIYLSSNNNLNVENSTLSHNNADRNGGALYLVESNDLTITNSRLLRNEAYESGGAISSDNDNNATVLNSLFIRNKAIWRGGAIMLGIDCHINMTNSSMKSNSARWGGGVFLESGVVAIVSSTYFSITYGGILGNNASRGGGIYAGMDCDISVYASTFTKNHAEFGGCFSGVSLSSKVKNSTFWNNSASQSGGCFYIEYSNADFEANTFDLNQAKKNGGAIHATSNSLLHLEEDHIISNSALNGGGIALISDSRILCVSGMFQNNTSNGGGGVYIESRMTQIITAQFGKSTFLNNSASQYGGGIAIKTFGSKSFDCKSAIEPCSRILLIDTSFVSNIANHSGSAILATITKNVLVSCEAWFWIDLTMFIQVSDIQQAQRYWGLANVTKSASPCESWKDNRLGTGASDQVIGTFGQKINITTNSTDGAKVHGDSELGFVLRDVNISNGFPILIVQTIDAFGNFPAPLLFEKNALTLNSSSKILADQVAFSFVNGMSNISSIFSRSPKGNYPIDLATKEEDVLQPSNITISIIECGTITEQINSFKIERCAQCSNTSLQGIHVVPKKGYWNRSPRDREVKACIIEEACEFQRRTETLVNFTRDLDNCNISDPLLTNYTNAQCHKGYKGPLCGTCKKSYGSSSNFECKKCGPIIMSVLTLIGITFYLLFGTSITIKGVLPLSSQQPRSEDIETPITEASTSILEDTLNQQSRETNEGSNNVSQEGTSTSSDSQQQEDDITIAKLKIIETWKILLNFLQVTSTAATLDVEWTDKVLNTIEKCQVFGAATINSVSRPLDCLLSMASRGTRVIWRTLFSIFIPTTVIGILAIYWGYRAVVVRNGDGSYFMKRFVLTTITTTYITYFELTQVAVRIFNCVVVHDHIDTISKSFTRLWMADTSIECYKSIHVVLIGISLVVLIVVSIGFPLVCSLALYVKKNEVNTINSWAHDTLSFLCGPFKERFVYWECVTMIKKALLSIIIVFSYSLGNQAQGLLILMVLGFFLYFHMLCNPYDKTFKSLNYYEGGSLLTSCTVYTLVQFLNVETLAESSRNAVSFCLILTTSLFACVMVYKILSNVIRLLTVILESKNVHIEERTTWFSILKIYYKNRKEIHSFA